MIVDSTVIDINTYSRSVAPPTDLPAGHGWAANGNRKVAEESLGFPNTQAVMYSRGVRGMRYAGLSADEANTVRMGMTGADKIAATADDYTVVLRYEPNCEAGDIVVNFKPLAEGTVGACLADIALSFPPPNPILAQHYSIVRVIIGGVVFDLEVTLNSDLPWDFTEPIFADGFESGDTSAWSGVVP